MVHPIEAYKVVKENHDLRYPIGETSFLFDILQDINKCMIRPIMLVGLCVSICGTVATVFLGAYSSDIWIYIFRALLIFLATYIPETLRIITSTKETICDIIRKYNTSWTYPNICRAYNLPCSVVENIINKAYTPEQEKAIDAVYMHDSMLNSPEYHDSDTG